MKSREHGESKVSVVVVWEFFSLLVNKLLGKYVPLKFMLFVAVGFTGVFVHMATLYITNQIMQWQFIYAQSLSVFVAMTSNYFLNNAFTFNDSKHTGIFVFKRSYKFLYYLFTGYTNQCLCGHNCEFAGNVMVVGRHSRGQL